jgi:hypothetical protein
MCEKSAKSARGDGNLQCDFARVSNNSERCWHQRSIRASCQELCFEAKVTVDSARLLNHKRVRALYPFMRLTAALHHPASGVDSCFGFLTVQSTVRNVFFWCLGVLPSAIGAPRINRLRLRFVLSRQRSTSLSNRHPSEEGLIGSLYRGFTFSTSSPSPSYSLRQAGLERALA